nr:DNA primase [uncultured bacterium]
MDDDKAIKAWKDNAPEWATPPAYADPAWKKEIAQAKRAAELDDAMRGPSVGVTQIDDKAATAIRYERTEKDGQPAYNVSFTMDNKTVAKLKGLDDIDLENAVGDKNAKAIREADADKGTLKGSALASEYGLSPEENARRVAAKEERKQAEFERMQPDDPTEKNVVSHEPEKLEEINVDEALARVARMREVEKQQRLAAEQNQLGQQAEGKRIKVENLSEKAQEQDDANRIAERTGADTAYPEQVSTEREKNRQVELMQQVHQQFRVSGAKFHFKDQPQRVAFKDKGPRMVSASNDERVAHAMATMAEAKGWKTIRVSGHPDFQREVWMEANLRGIEVRGFKPQEKDLKELEARRDLRSKNVVEHEATQTRQDAQKGRQGAQQDAGKAQAAPQPEKAPERSDKAKVVAAVAAEVLAEKVKDPKQRDAIMKAINERLEQREKVGKVPSVPVYDKAAPTTQQQPERSRPQVERNAERTR